MVEVDGRAFHSSYRRFESDRSRDAVVVAAGLRVLPAVIWQQIVNEPARCASGRPPRAGPASCAARLTGGCGRYACEDTLVRLLSGVAVILAALAGYGLAALRIARVARRPVVRASMAAVNLSTLYLAAGAVTLVASLTSRQGHAAGAGFAVVAGGGVCGRRRGRGLRSSPGSFLFNFRSFSPPLGITASSAMVPPRLCADLCNPRRT